MSIEIGELLDRNPWPAFAKFVTVLCAMAIIFDGFDISIIGLAIPSILREWHLPPKSLAPLVVIGFVGMTIGSTTAGFVADRLGRRFGLSLSVLVFGLATLASAFAGNLRTIELLRFVAAAGIGGALPTAATLSAEFTPLKMRTIAVMSTIVCVPFGSALAGSVAQAVLPIAGWRGLFMVGGATPIVLSLLMLIALPESPRFLARKVLRAPELIKLLGRMRVNVAPDATFVDAADRKAGQGSGLQDFFSPMQTRSTLCLWLTFFSSLANVYLCFSWLPTFLTTVGLAKIASQGLAAYNYGGVVGVFCFVALVNRFGSRSLTLSASLLAALTAVILIGMETKSGASATLLLAGLAAEGLCVNALQTSLYALGVHLYPTRARASGVAVASAVGRLGAICSAILGPVLIQFGRVPFFAYLTVAMLLAFVGLVLLRDHIPSLGAQRVAA